MGQNEGYVKRDRLDILLGILALAQIPVKKTHILYKVNINFHQLARYLGLLLVLGMLEEIHQPYKSYRTTEKGRQLLTLFNSSPEILENQGKSTAKDIEGVAEAPSLTSSVSILS